MDSAASNRAEAIRWLTAAEKLLFTRDLNGSRTFTIRARESDPTFETPELLLVVVDTLLAGESRINDQHDWYAILRLVRYTQDMDLIANQYQRLAVLLDPRRNRVPLSADASALVYDAWMVLSNPSRKALYDNELRVATEPTTQLQLQQQHYYYPQLPQHQAQQTHATLQFRTSQLEDARRSSTSGDDEAVVEEERPSLNLGLDSTQRTQTVNQSTQREDGSTEREDETTPQAEATNETTRSMPESDVKSFWTACPYCYVLYEYPEVYEECTLKCQKCRRAFHAAVILSPGVAGEGTNFCSWGIFPLGFSYDGNKGRDIPRWTPFSNIFACPFQNSGNVSARNENAGKGKKVHKAPRVYFDESDVFVELPNTSEEDSGDEWEIQRRKRVKNAQGKSTASKYVAWSQAERSRRGNQNPNLSNGENIVGNSTVENAARPESSRKAALNARRKGAADLGKLDLNVEFSNEAEDPARGARGSGTANGAEDNMEGIAFFEGLDEFLSSLPILNVVNDDKAKAS